MRIRRKKTRAVGRTFAGRRPRVMLAIAAAGLLGLSLASIAPAAPASAAAARFVIYNAHSRDCMTNDGKANVYVTQAPCNGRTSQQWYFGGNHGSYQQIKNDATNQCIGLADASLADGAKIQMWNCSSNDQYYWEEGNGCPLVGPCYIPPGWVNLQNQASLRVMQVGCDCDNNGAPIIDATPNAAGPPDQLWAVDYGDQGP
jgi:Ricin-type beta-trefoil lectin domain-like